MRAILTKELLVLGRDLHGLLVLFAMPLAFILIMSLAMQEEYSSRAASEIDVWVVDEDATAASDRAVQLIAELAPYRVLTDPKLRLAALREQVGADQVRLAVHIPARYFEQVALFDGPPAATTAAAPIEILAAPSVRKPMALLLAGTVKEAVARIRLDALLRDLEADLGALGADEGEADSEADQSDPTDFASASRSAQRASPVPADAIRLSQLGSGDAEATEPTAVQQSVPAWLVFAMFFVVIPLSNTFIAERQLRTFERLRSLDVAPSWLLIGKLVPYAAVHQVQVVLMLAIGVYVVPLLGGDTLTLGRSPLGLGLMASATSLAALGLALLVAVVSRTTEQATVLGGAGSILLGALGGIMVPRFIMPAAMQQLSWISPMAWGLEGFLDVLLRGGGVRDVAPEAAALAGFGIVALIAAAWRLRASAAHA